MMPCNPGTGSGCRERRAPLCVAAGAGRQVSKPLLIRLLASSPTRLLDSSSVPDFWKMRRRMAMVRGVGRVHAVEGHAARAEGLGAGVGRV